VAIFKTIGYVGGMAVKSKAQRRKFAQLLVEGKIKPEVYERWNREAGKKALPERVRKRGKKKTKAKAKRRKKR
jgi:hypothetical protein